MKTLSIFIRDGGDGSQSLVYCLDDKIAHKFYNLIDNEDDGFPDWVIKSYQSGDGIKLRKLQVPHECTYESLGIHEDLTVESVLKEYYLD